MVIQQISCLLSRQSKQNTARRWSFSWWKCFDCSPKCCKATVQQCLCPQPPSPTPFALPHPLLLLFYPSFPLSADHGKLISICFTVIWHNSSIAAAVPARWARLPPAPAAHRLPAGSRHREPWLSTLLAGGFPTASSKRTLDCATTKVLYAPHPPLEPVVVFFLHIQLPLKCMLDCGVTLLSPPSRIALQREGANTAASVQASDTANVCSFKSKCNQGWLMEMQSGIDLALMGLQPTGLRGSELCLEGSMYHWWTATW